MINLVKGTRKYLLALFIVILIITCILIIKHGYEDIKPLVNYVRSFGNSILGKQGYDSMDGPEDTEIVSLINNNQETHGNVPNDLDNSNNKKFSKFDQGSLNVVVGRETCASTNGPMHRNPDLVKEL
jgi:hypothetical protein